MRDNLLLVFAMVLVASIRPVWAQSDPPREMNLLEATQYAWQNTLTMKNAQLDLVDADEQISERLATGLPKIDGTVSYQHYLQIPAQPLPPEFIQLLEAIFPGEEISGETAFFLPDNFTASVSMDAMLFDGTFFIGLQAARAYKEYIAQDIAVKRRQVRSEVLQAYLPVLLIDENLRIIGRNIENLDKLFSETKATYEQGFSEKLDVDRIQLSLSNLETERDRLQRQRTNSLNALKLAIGYPLDEPLALTETLESALSGIDAEDLTGEVVLTERPEFQLVNQAIELSELDERNFKSRFYPSLYAFGSYQQQYQGGGEQDGFWAPSSFLGVRLNVPIFDGMNRQTQVDRARIRTEKTLNEKWNVERSIRLEVMNARTKYNNAREGFQRQRDNLDLAERIYETTQIKYREGIGSSIEVTQAEQELYDTQSNYIAALYDLVVAKYELELALGK